MARAATSPSSRHTTVDVVPFVPLPLSGRQWFTYRVPPHLSVATGQTVRIPFGPRTVSGIVWNVAHPRTLSPGTKDLLQVSSPSLLLPTERIWLTELSALSLEPLALLVKALASVRAPLLASLPTQRFKKHPFSVVVDWRAPAHSALPEEGQTLFLAPDTRIAMEAQAAWKECGENIPFFAQGMPKTKRRSILMDLVEGRARAVIATHAGIFLLFSSLKNIVVLETPLSSHRQWDLHPRYDARVAALVRARNEGAKVTYESTLPSVDLHVLARQEKSSGKEPTFSAAVRYRSLTDVQLFHPDILAEIQKTLRAEKAVCIFHDVVGFERQYMCTQCGYQFRCEECGGLLQRKQHQLLCMQCGTSAGPVRSFCPRCKSPNVHAFRTGTGALEEQLAPLFPGTPITRLDRDVVRRTRTPSTHSINGAELLLATERAFAVLPRHTLGTIVFFDADSLFRSPFHDRAEQALHILARGHALTEMRATPTVWIQTSMPSLPLFHALEHYTLSDWMNTEADERAFLSFPPFASMLRVIKQSASEKTATTDIQQAFRRLADSPSLRIGSRVRVYRTGVEAELLLRGNEKTLREARDLLPRTWTVDPYISFAHLLV